VLQKMQATLAAPTINRNNSMASSAEVDNILGQIQKEATRNTSSKHMQVIGLEEEVRLKEVTIRGLYMKISTLQGQLHQSNEKIAILEGVEAENKDLKVKVTELEKVQEENKKLEQEMVTLKEKNTKVLQTAKEHQKGWKECVSKTEKKAAENENENLILRSKMTKLMRTLEATVAEFSDLSGADASLPLAASSSSEESEDCDTTEDKNTASEDKRDDCEQDTKVEKGVVATTDIIAERMSTSACFMSCPTANE